MQYTVIVLVLSYQPGIFPGNVRRLTDPDKEIIKKLCAALRKPGGLINGLLLPDGTAPRLPSPGVNISQWAEMNLTTACYMANHYV
jgi:hypothetical protein